MHAEELLNNSFLEKAQKKLTVIKQKSDSQNECTGTYKDQEWQLAGCNCACMLGGDLVGMSTVLEAITARSLGAEVFGLSLVTNLAAGLSGQPLNHEEVLEAGRVSASRMGRLLRSLLEAA